MSPHVRLSAVILYEQVFGDNFLHTVQARQCIGQACRSALITPLIEKLTLRSKPYSPKQMYKISLMWSMVCIECFDLYGLFSISYPFQSPLYTSWEIPVHSVMYASGCYNVKYTCVRQVVITILLTALICIGSGGPDLGQSIHDYIGQMQPPIVSQWRSLASCVSGVGGASQDIGAGSRTLDMDIFSQDSLEPLDFDKAQKRLVKVSVCSWISV